MYRPPERSAANRLIAFAAVEKSCRTSGPRREEERDSEAEESASPREDDHDRCDSARPDPGAALWGGLVGGLLGLVVELYSTRAGLTQVVMTLRDTPTHENV